VNENTAENDRITEDVIVDSENEAMENEAVADEVQVDEPVGEVLPNDKEEQSYIKNSEGEINTRKGDMGHNYNLRPSRMRDYGHKFSFLSVNAGLKKWGDDAKRALSDKLNLFIRDKVLRIQPKHKRKML